MLKHIVPSQLRLGMYIHALDGSWLSHGFWKSSFKLKTTADLQRLQASGIAGLWIDLARGLDVQPAAAPAQPIATPAAPPAPVDAPSLWQEQIEQARQQCKQAQSAVMQMFHEARMGHAIEPEQAEALAEQIQQSVERHPAALLSVVRLKNADTYTYMHSVAVSALMVALARQLGLSTHQVKRAAAGRAAARHGQGLHQPGYSEQARRLYWTRNRSHESCTRVQGHALLQQSITDAEVLDACLHHHERLDGKGYPHGLHGAEIHLMARMTAICDVYDAITSNRPYKSGWSPAIALQRMAQWCGTHLDTHIFSAFVKTLGVYPVGGLLRLQSGRLALVFALSENKLLTPRWSAFTTPTRRGASTRPCCWI